MLRSVPIAELSRTHIMLTHPRFIAMGRSHMSKPETSAAVCVAALYRFARFDDCPGVRDRLDTLCREHGIRGTLLIASEGINGTIAGTHEGIATDVDAIRALPDCADLDVKLSSASSG